MYRQTGRPGQVRGGQPFISDPESRPFGISIPVAVAEKDSAENSERATLAAIQLAPRDFRSVPLRIRSLSRASLPAVT